MSWLFWVGASIWTVAGYRSVRAFQAKQWRNPATWIWLAVAAAGWTIMQVGK